MQKRARDYGVNKGAKRQKKRASKSMVKVVQRIMQRTTETKVCDTYQTAYTLYNTNPVVGDLCQIQNGASDVQRVGSKIKPVGIVCRYTLSNLSAAIGGKIRVLLVQDMRQTTSSPALTEFLYDINGASNVASAYLMPKNYEQSANFKVLHDEEQDFGPSTTSREIVSGYFKITYAEAFKEVNFKGTSAALSDNSSGRLFLLICTNHAPIGLTAPTVVYHHRLYYKDS